MALLINNRSFRNNVIVLLAGFIVSRMIVKIIGLSFAYDAIYDYWQYLDVQSLQHNLLQSLWYQHSQPPVFNLLLGIVLKCSQTNAPQVFEILFLVISFSNAYLLLYNLNKTTGRRYLPIIISLTYALSPATILYENELFYTSFTSMLLLLLIAFVINFISKPSIGSAIGMFSMLTLICLTRSTYHLILLMIVCSLLVFAFYKKCGSKLIIIGSLVSFSIVSGWYAKNYFIFGDFSASSWLGINFSRIVFHDAKISDSSTIAFVHPGLPLFYYKKYINDDYIMKYAGLNDRILLHEMKNDSFINMNNAGFLQVSQKYLEAGKQYIKQKPASYLAHTAASFIIFFSPASSYFKVQQNNDKICYYDLIFSFNLSHLFKEKEKKRIALAISALPVFISYLVVFFVIIKDALKRRYISTVNSLIIIITLFILMVSALFEYGENMRFRYELHPLFLILASQALLIVINKFNISKPEKIPLMKARP